MPLLHYSVPHNRNGTLLSRWVNDKTAVNTLTVLTDGPAAGGQPGIFYNLSAGETVYIADLAYQLTTVSDDCRFEFGYTSAASGGGTFIPVTPLYRIQTGASLFRLPQIQLMTPPIAIAYVDGTAMSVTVRVQTNDAAARITIGWHGWVE